MFRAAVPMLPDDAPDRDSGALLPAAPGLATLIAPLERRFAALAEVARAEVPILVRGETGTGKELIARAVHALAQRGGRRGPFMAVFLVTDLTNRSLGPTAARRVAWVGFALAVVVSLLLAPWRIALASGSAFILAQILDISLFNRLRRLSWWKAPLLGSLAASVLDTAVFFFLAFAGTDLDWTLLAAGDLAVKAAMAALLLAPYRLMLPRLQVWATPS